MTLRRRGGAGGFTLLEVMIAVGILAMSLMWLVEATTRAIAAENHAKLVGTATFLARGRLVELEDELQEKGFTDDSFTKETTGDFDEKGFKRFKWSTLIDKVELPQSDKVQGAIGDALSGGKAGAGGPTGIGGFASGSSTGAGAAGSNPMGAGMLGMFFPVIKDVLEQGIRRAIVKVTWTENGRDQSVEVTEYLTDPRRIDMAISMPQLPNGQQKPPPGAPPTGNEPPAGGGPGPGGGGLRGPAVIQ